MNNALKIAAFQSLWFTVNLGILALYISLNPCPYEDSKNCYWNAETMGNGQGQSFVTIGNIDIYFRTY